VRLVSAGPFPAGREAGTTDSVVASLVVLSVRQACDSVPRTKQATTSPRPSYGPTSSRHSADSRGGTCEAVVTVETFHVHLIGRLDHRVDHERAVAVHMPLHAHDRSGAGRRLGSGPRPSRVPDWVICAQETGCRACMPWRGQSPEVSGVPLPQASLSVEVISTRVRESPAGLLYEQCR
jgi:hypothetical protein